MIVVNLRVIACLVTLFALRPGLSMDIKLNVQPSEVQRGGNVTFTCDLNVYNGTVNGTVSVNRLDGKNSLVSLGVQELASETHFEMFNVDIVDGGSYVCKVDFTGSPNSIYSSHVNLTITYLEKPELKAQGHYFTIGQSVDFECHKPEGNPRPTDFTWFKDGSWWNYTTFADRPKTVNRRLQIKTLKDSGSYQCKAESLKYSGTYGISSNSVVIRVFEVLTESTATNEDEENATITCEIRPNDMNTINNTATWTKHTLAGDTEVLEDSDKYAVKRTAGLLELTVNRVNRSDEGTYRCHFILDGHNFSKNAQLNVSYMDQPNVLSKNRRLKQGESTLITCVNLNAQPHVDDVTWFKNNMEISKTDKSNYNVSDDGRQLSVVNFSVTNAGVYKCRAESKIFSGRRGKTSANSIKLNYIFLNDPKVRVSPDKLKVGETVEIYCLLPEGNPPPNKVIWIQDGKEIETNTIDEEDIKRGEMKIEQVIDGKTKVEYSCAVQSMEFQQENVRQSNVTLVTISVVDPNGILGDRRLDPYLIAGVVVAILTLILLILLVHTCCFKSIRLVVQQQQITDAKQSIVIVCNYRPRLARAYSVQWVTPHGPLPLMKFPSCINMLKERVGLKEIPSDGEFEHQTPNTDPLDRMKVSTSSRGKIFLEINNITAFDSGKYTCIISRSSGKRASSHTAVITIHSKLLVVAGDTFTNVDSLTISCVSLPYNEPVDSFIWFHADETGEVKQGHGNALASSTDIASRGRYSCACEDTTCYLRINEPCEEDAGIYQCKVIRKYDNIPFQGAIVLEKDAHTLEWKVSQFRFQASTPTNKAIPKRYSVFSGGKEVLRMDSFDVNDETLQTTVDTSINDAINGNDETLQRTVDTSINDAINGCGGNTVVDSPDDIETFEKKSNIGSLLDTNLNKQSTNICGVGSEEHVYDSNDHINGIDNEKHIIEGDNDKTDNVEDYSTDYSNNRNNDECKTDDDETLKEDDDETLKEDCNVPSDAIDFKKDKSENTATGEEIENELCSDNDESIVQDIDEQYQIEDIDDVQINVKEVKDEQLSIKCDEENEHASYSIFRSTDILEESTVKENTEEDIANGCDDEMD